MKKHIHNQQSDNKLIIYQSKAGALELKADIKHETIWLTQQQVATLFDVQKSAISKHVKNIFSSGELEPKETVSKMETVQVEGKKQVKRLIDYYHLDLVLSIGYRVNSKQATRFRQWATKTLKEHILKGYTINRKRIQANYNEFQEAVAHIKNLLPANSLVDNNSIVELISLFADTWLSLDAFDKDKLITYGATKRKIQITANTLAQALNELKKTLLAKKEATDFFGTERTPGSLTSIVSNVMQSFDKKYLYPSIEEKASHLLYFIIKNHPFIDGNKRCGAYAFIWFLRQAKILDTTKITPPALTVLTLLIAESNPKDKERMVGLVCALLAPRK